MASPPPYTLNVVGSEPQSFTGTTSTSYYQASSQHSSSASHNINTSVLIILIVLAVTSTVWLSLYLLLRLLNLQCLRRPSLSYFSSSSRRNATPATATATTNATETATATAMPVFSSSRRFSLEIPSTSTIDSLPMFEFSSITRCSSACDTTVGGCAVCLSKFEQQDLLRLLPLCCHAFHVECIDTWLQSNLTCPLCRSAIFASDSELMKVLQSSLDDSGGSNSFRREIGNISHRGPVPPDEAGDLRARSRSYSVGSFEYFVDEDLEVPISHGHQRSVSDNKDELVSVESQSPAAQSAHEASLGANVSRSGSSWWLKEYADRLSSSISSRTVSFRGSGRFFTSGNASHQSDAGISAEDCDLEAMRLGEEISETFRWLSVV
ncbi:hypothetical protein QN277_022951 [Acacia crassicarpa]|uniref:RING-type E3 ubiquitin transferase n=1 Tax=Acacia crassicarpa TaxID=499986 RepID=A0AAE1MLI5_9FABA|nr:hypothetical protein QN277_022951 [Acacia crassicarpa]